MSTRLSAEQNQEVINEIQKIQDKQERPQIPQNSAPVKQESKKALFEPYLGKESLESSKVTYSKDGKTKSIRAGKPKYGVERSGDVFKLIAYYKNGKGVARKLVRALKPMKRGAIDDRALMNQLYGFGIPGAVKVR